jgi:hypothetical protein
MFDKEIDIFKGMIDDKKYIYFDLLLVVKDISLL